MIRYSRTVGILLCPGTNCHRESKRAIEQAGLEADLVFHREIVDGRKSMCDYAAWILAGGFGWGDHIRAGRVQGFALGDYLRAFIQTTRAVIGICNGDQALFETGVFHSPEGATGGALVQNQSGRFESRWTMVKALPGSWWTEGYEGADLRLPVAHGEGRWYIPQGVPAHLTPIFAYTHNGIPTEEYPYNPAGTPGGICGVAYNNILGMMPHPERATSELIGSTAGRLVFNALARRIRSE